MTVLGLLLLVISALDIVFGIAGFAVIGIIIWGIFD